MKMVLNSLVPTCPHYKNQPVNGFYGANGLDDNSNVLSVDFIPSWILTHLLRQLSLLFIAQLTKYAAIWAYGASRSQMECPPGRLRITLPAGSKAVCFHLHVIGARNHSRFSKPCF